MSNATTIMENLTYNLSKIISTDIIDEPTTWLFNFNNEMSGVFLLAIMIVFSIVLFLLARNLEEVADTQAAVYSLLIVSVLGLLLFFIEVDGAKLLEFTQLLPFIIGLGLAVGADRLVRDS